MIEIDAHTWAALVARVAALEARDADLAGQIAGLREDWRRLESRLYAIVATGVLGGSAAAGFVSNVIGG